MKYYGPLKAIAVLLLYFYAPFNAKSSVDIISTRVCFGDTTTLSIVSTIPATASVLWDLDNDGFFNNGSGNIVKQVFATADTLTVRAKVIDSSGLEFFSTAHDVIIDPLPNSNFFFVATCIGQTTRFTNTTSIANGVSLTYEWDFDSNSTIDDTATSPNKLFPDTGLQVVSLTAISLDGCKQTMSKNIPILPKPIVSFTAEPSCNGELSRFINQTTFAGDSVISRIWKFGDGALVFSTDTATHYYQSSGTYNVILKVTGSNGCSDSLLQSVVVDANVIYNYTFIGDSLIYENGSTQVEVTGNFATILWEDNSSSPKRTFTDTGEYSFLVSTSGGCSLLQNIYVARKPSDGPLQKANDFLTPNGDGKNDYLYFKNMEQEKPCAIAVYDINSLKVYESDDYQNDWDGTSKGKQVAAGTYYYFLKCANIKELRGNTNIVR